MIQATASTTAARTHTFLIPKVHTFRAAQGENVIRV